MKPYVNSIKLKPLLISLALPLFIGGIAGFITGGSMDAYRNLEKPFLTPPDAVFPIVWTILFALMGVSSYLIFMSSAPKKDKRNALSLYIYQLVVNFLWSILFFNFEARLLAFLWLLLLVALVALMIKEFYKISPIAAYLQMPYLIWIVFAGYLNLAIFLLNR